MTTAERMKQFRGIMAGYRERNPKEYEWLELSLLTIGFFECPASIKHHGAYEGGLFDHSFTVAKCLRSLTDRLELKWEREESPELVGILHDICKTLKFKKMPSGEFEYIPEAPQGHGDLSVEMLTEKSYSQQRKKKVFTGTWEHLQTRTNGRNTQQPFRNTQTYYGPIRQI